MPNPSFMPIIGSGFGDIAQQQQYWAGFNRTQDEANLARAAEAQRTRNAYLAQVARMQQEDADRQAQLQLQSGEIARGQARQQYEDTESRRRFDVGTKLTEQQQDLERTHWNFNINERNKAERKALDLAENFGKAKSTEADDLGSKLDDATAAYNDAKAGLDKAISRIQGKYPGVAWDNRQKMFVDHSTKPDAEKVRSANDEFSDAKAEADRAAIDFSTAHEAYMNLQKEASSYGLTVQKQGKKRVLFSPAHNRFFGEVSSSNANTNPFESEFGADTSGASEMRNPMTPYAGFTQGTGTGSPADTMTPDQRIPSHRFPNNYSSVSPYSPTSQGVLPQGKVSLVKDWSSVPADQRRRRKFAPIDLYRYRDETGKEWVYWGGKDPNTDRDPSQWKPYQPDGSASTGTNAPLQVGRFQVMPQ